MFGQSSRYVQPPRSDSKHWLHDFDSGPSRPTPPRSIYGIKGVDRMVILATGTLTDADIERIITHKAKELAAEGKRIYLPPKWLSDGLAVDWIYDRSIHTESLASIMRAVPRISVKGMSFQAPGHPGSNEGSSMNPIVLDDDHDMVRTYTSPASERSPELSPNGSAGSAPNQDSVQELKRKTLSDAGSLFTLSNLSLSMDEVVLRQNMIDCGIPSDAVVSIRVRRSLGPGTSAVATIDVAQGYNPSVVKNQLLCSWAASALSHSSSAQSATTSTTAALLPMAPVQVIDLDRTPTPPADAVMSISGDEHEDPHDLEPQNLSRHDGASARVSASPALTYVTAIELFDREAQDTATQDAHADGTFREDLDPLPLGHFSDPLERSSDQESESDNDSAIILEETAQTAFLQRETSEEYLNERLLHGPINTINELLQDDDTLDDHLRIATNERPRSSASGSRGREQRADRPRDARIVRRLPTQHHPAATRAAPARADARPPRTRPHDDSLVVNDGETIAVPKSTWAKGRRLLVPSSPDVPIAAVYMRGDCQFIDQGRRERIAHFSLPVDEDNGESRHVVDALVLENTAIVAYNEGRTQVSCVRLSEEPRPVRYDLAHRAHNVVQEHRRIGTSSPNHGIASMCVLNAQSLRFLSAGEDGAIQLWSLAYSRNTFQARSRALGIHHPQRVRCVAYDPVKSQVYSCFSRFISIAHLEAPKAGPPIMLSSNAQQCHVHPQHPDVIILEVDHRDRQIQVYDTRKSSFRDTPCIEFGQPLYATTNVIRREYRFYKGSTVHSLFARGYQDGSVCVWDYRNAQAPFERFGRKRRDPVEHALLLDHKTLAGYGGHTVTFWGINNT